MLVGWLRGMWVLRCGCWGRWLGCLVLVVGWCRLGWRLGGLLLARWWLGGLAMLERLRPGRRWSWALAGTGSPAAMGVWRRGGRRRWPMSPRAAQRR